MSTTVEATLGKQHKSILYSANCAQSFQSGVQPLVLKVKSSLARELKILVSVVRFRPGPPSTQTAASAQLFSFYPSHTALDAA
jgi:hypothetical protein